MKTKAYGATDVGLVRLNNEDAYALLPEEQCYLLADGMGGHQAGEIAANETVRFLSARVQELSPYCPTIDEWVEHIEQAIQDANLHILHLAEEDEEKEGMGTTLCLALQMEDTLIHAHVGDSRIYRIRKRRISRLTQDHSLRGDMIARGEIEENHSGGFPYKNVITRAIGTQATVTPDIGTTTTYPNDLFLLCSDGLTDGLSDEEILSCILTSSTLKQATNKLILEAKKKGGNDNITLILIKSVKSEDPLFR